MGRHVWLPGLLALVLAGTARPASAQPDSGSPRVSLALTYDASVSRQSVLVIEDLFRRYLTGRNDYRVVHDSEPFSARLSPQAISRRDLVLRQRRRGTEYAADIRVSEAQLPTGGRYTVARAWLASADSAQYAVVSEAWWVPGDTLTMRRQIALLLDRLVPVVGKRVCYVQVTDQRVRRDPATSVVREATVDLSARMDGREPAAGARIWGHWLVNTVPESTETVLADGLGAARVRYDGGQPPRSVAEVSFAVDSASCAGALFDQQHPQREVDRALALLENARADLDEDRDYEGAIAKAQRFAELSEEDIEWYGVLTTPLDAPDRREQAAHLLRRARTERDYKRLEPAAHSRLSERFRYGVWFGYDLVGPWGTDRRADPVGCGDTCDALALSARYDRRADLGGFAQFRAFSRVWVGASGSFGYGRIGRTAVGTDVFASSSTTIAASVWVPHELRNETDLYGELGLRLTRHSEGSARRYWVDGQPGSGPPGQVPYWREREPSRGFRPGVELGVGVSVRMSDWQPMRLDVDLRGICDTIGEDLRWWRAQARVGLSFGR